MSDTHKGLKIWKKDDLDRLEPFRRRERRINDPGRSWVNLL